MLYIYIYVCIYIHRCIERERYIHVYIHIYIYASLYLSLSLYIYIYIERERDICIYTYIYIYIHTHVDRLSRWEPQKWSNTPWSRQRCKTKTQSANKHTEATRRRHEGFHLCITPEDGKLNGTTGGCNCVKLSPSLYSIGQSYAPIAATLSGKHNKHDIYVYVCMYVCMYIYIYICAYVCMYVCMYIYIYI